MADFSDYESFDALALADLVRRREVSPSELLDAAMARVERLNPQLNAFVALFERRARADIASGLPAGPFTGVPFALKDLFMSYEGELTQNGSQLWAGHVASHTSELFARYRRAGVVIFGKTNTPELGYCVTTEPDAFGPTRNPWDLERTPGGSSGGAAAAVAAGIIPIAHASDSGGSIRIPASCCGLFGLKPSRGRIPMGPERGESSGGNGTAHAVSRSVRDSAALLDATAGPGLGDPYGIAPPVRSWFEEASGGSARLRVAVAATPPGGVDVHPDCAQAMKDAAALCRDLGHEVDEAVPAIDYEALDAAGRVIFSGATRALIDARAAQLGRAPTEEDLETATWKLYQAAAAFSAADYAKALEARHRAGRELAVFQQSWDLILTPTLAQPPVPIGEIRPSGPNAAQFNQRMSAFAPFSRLANATGVPAASVPLHWNAQGLPIGVQFVARFGDEAALIRIAAQLEQARPWRGRRPPPLSS